MWCLDVLRKNEPDDEEKMNYIFKNSPTHVACPIELGDIMAGDAVYNAYATIKMNFESLKKYYTQDDIDWIKSYFKDIVE